MKRFIFTLGLVLISFSMFSQNSIYDFTVKDINGHEFPLSQLKGKKVMIINVASKCGFTPQYKELEEIYQKYKDDGFVIVGFPANNFMHQEPGNDEEIKTFCTSTYGVTFPMMSKISVKGGDMAPLYKWLTKKQLNGKLSSSVKWNFQKYLIGRDGKIDYVINPWIKPDNKKIVSWITSN
ncbi:MAG: glutathione peroxidase [Bacteroidales bacterium]|nr:glutathione peroxidase [Bacteroidales bacterium]